MHILRCARTPRCLLSVLAIACGAALPAGIASALIIPPTAISTGSFGYMCSATGLCPPTGTSPPSGFAGLVQYMAATAIPAAQTLLIGIATLYLGWYALTMIIKGNEESAYTEQRKAFGYAAVGMAFAGLASLIVQTAAPGSARTALIAPLHFSNAVNLVVNALTISAGAFLVFHIGLAGFRLIALQGNEGEIDKQKKSFFNGLIGIMVLLLAKVAVQAIVPGSFTLVGGIPVTGSSNLIIEIGGVAQFLLQIVAALAVVVLIGSGVLYIVSLHNDALKQRARRMVFSTIIILIVVIFSYTLVSTFIQ